jgi:hypothetical protein
MTEEFDKQLALPRSLMLSFVLAVLKATAS